MIVLKLESQINKLRTVNRIGSEVLSALKSYVEPGITTLDLDRIASNLIKDKGCSPAFLGYNGYPNTITASLNSVVTHGIPSNVMLKEGDILSIDIGLELDGYCSDSAITTPVGSITHENHMLIQATELSMYRGIQAAVVGNRIMDISIAIEKTAAEYGFYVVKEFCGHGVGKILHEAPTVANYNNKDNTLIMPGMVLAIEPILIERESTVELLPDGWSVITTNDCLAAHFEHSIAIYDGGPEILSSFHSQTS